MKKRPFFNYKSKELNEIFINNKNDNNKLIALLNELKYRKTSSMVTLRNDVEKKIKNLKSNKSSVKTITKKGVINNKKQNNPEYEWDTPEYEWDTPEYEWESSPDLTSIKSDKKSIITEKHYNDELDDNHSIGLSVIGKIRRPGKIAGVPTSRQFELKDDIKLDVRKNAPLAEIYAAGTKALITEIRKKKKSIKKIVLENGVKIMLDGKENGYQFPYEVDPELFEGAGVTAVVGSSKTDGRIVGLTGNIILISLQQDFGPKISVCVLRIDNTAMLEALYNRLEKIVKGEVPEFNTALAEAVLLNKGEEVPQAFVPGEFSKGLNETQKEAIAKIVSNEIFYLWGPPGTGKTQTLSALCMALLDSDKRILLCSNTNQAVDQVLLKICTLFGKNHPAIIEGQIVRLGKIAHDKFEEVWGDYVKDDKIAERKSVKLLERKNLIEIKLEHINQSISVASKQMDKFKTLDGYKEQSDSLNEQLKKIQADITSSLEQRIKLEKQLSDLRAESNKVLKSGAIVRAFLRSNIEIEADIRRTNNNLVSSINDEKKFGADKDKLAKRIAEVNEATEKVRVQVVNVDRKKVEEKLSNADKEKQPLIQEISEINKELEDIRKSVLKNARIVGATVTKAYLSPQYFNAFDVVIIDEASMVMLPALFNVAGMAKEKVVISGDYRQLAPIVQTEQKEIFKAIGTDIFHYAKIDKFEHRKTMLKEQFRMDDKICKLISSRMYEGELFTSSKVKPDIKARIKPFDNSLTIIDTSPIWPFVNKDPFESRYNLMNALTVRNLCKFFEANNYLTVKNEDDSIDKRIGVCTPYAAQSKVLQRILEGSNLKNSVEAGTVHRYQGDEKHVMIIDIPDSYGEYRAGIFLDAENVNDAGSMLFNVAVSRAKDQLIILANLTYLDQKLPAYSFVREILSEIQEKGKVVDVRDVLAMYPITEDLRRLGTPFNLSPDAEKNGLFNQQDFETVCTVDMERAKKGIAIFSGFVTPQRVAKYESLFRRKSQERIEIRCITRPPQKNGSLPFEDGKAALDGLEKMGCLVDTRADIHEKVVIIDDEIIWFGSLNPLSHTSKTDEMMARIVSKDLAHQLATFMALDVLMKNESAAGLSTTKENPDCPECGSRTSYNKGKYGPYWKCEECDWKENFDKPNISKKTTKTDLGLLPACDKCGAPMAVRSSRYGEFLGCSAFPECKNIMKTKTKKRGL